MQKLTDLFDGIYIHTDAQDSELAQRCRELFPVGRIEVVRQTPFADATGEMSAQEFDRSKRNLYIAPFKGQFFKRCPGSRPGLACCNYYVLNWGAQCEMNCSYCYLQSFINSPVMTLYSNVDQALQELRDIHQSSGDLRLRVGTGETVDSLSLDHLTGHGRRLVEAFRDFPNWTVEFKTKSANVHGLLETESAGNVIVSWSINPRFIVETEEHRTAPTAERISAARRCLEKGYKIAFHIDPMIWHPDWEHNYGELVDQICANFAPSDVPYLSVGALRFQPEQRAMMRERFGMKSWVTRAEMHPSQDGKWRYDQELRKQMFNFVLNRFRSHGPDWRIFMCMETPETWLQTQGHSPFKDQKMKDLFDTQVIRSVERVLR